MWVHPAWHGTGSELLIDRYDVDGLTEKLLSVLHAHGYIFTTFHEIAFKTLIIYIIVYSINYLEDF